MAERRKGGVRNRWEYNIKEWTVLNISGSLMVSKDRKGLREVIRRTVVVPVPSSVVWKTGTGILVKV